MDDDTTDKEPVATPALPEPRPNPECDNISRYVAHQAFDSLWQGDNPKMKRSEAYQWLARTLGIRRDEAHMSMFSAAQCQTVIAAVANIDLLCEINKSPSWGEVGARRAQKITAKRRKQNQREYVKKNARMRSR